jgi:hypothetical protein
LIERLNQRDWDFANKNGRLMIRSLSKTDLVEGEEGEVYTKDSMSGWKIRATTGVQSKQPVILKLMPQTWQPRVFELKPDLGRQTLELALLNAQAQMRSRLEAVTTTRQIKTRQAKNFLDALSTKEEVICQVKAEETGLALRIEIPMKAGVAIFEAQDEVTVHEVESRVAVFEQAQSRFINKFGSDSSYEENGLAKWLIDLAISEVA